MARVLFLSVVYQPDTVSTAVIAAQCVRQLRELGDDVGVLTSVPHYNVSPEAAADPRYRGRPWRPVLRDAEADQPVVRCYTPRRGTALAWRAFGLATLHLGMVYAALRHFRDREVVVIMSPPLTLVLIGLLLRRTSGAKVIYNVQELWPDVPRDLGVIRNRALLRLLADMERRIYRASDAVVAIGPRFAKTITDRGAPSERVVVVPNFVDTAWITPSPKDNRLAREWGLADKRVVLYAGNIGQTQDFDTLLAAAAALEEASVCFLVVGAGSGRPAFEARLRRDPRPSVVLKDYVPEERVAELYGLSDIVVVLLKRGHDRTTTPSKVLSAMAARRPLVVSASDDTDLAGTVRDNRAGIVVPLEDPQAVVAAVTRLLDGGVGAGNGDWDPDHALAAARARSPETVGGAYHDLIERLAGAPAPR